MYVKRPISLQDNCAYHYIMDHWLSDKTKYELFCSQIEAGFKCTSDNLGQQLLAFGQGHVCTEVTGYDA